MNSGETISCGVFGVKTLNTLRRPLQADRRSAGDILAVAHARAKERIRRLNEQRVAEAARRKAEDEANRARYLDQLGRREPEIWKQVAVHIQKRQPNDYARAVGLLTDLHDLAVRRGKSGQISDGT